MFYEDLATLKGTQATLGAADKKFRTLKRLNFLHPSFTNFTVNVHLIYNKINTGLYSLCNNSLGHDRLYSR